MPKQIAHLNQFHGGLSTSADARDIADSELDEATGVNVSSLGRIKILGDDVAHGEVPSTGDGSSIQPGYGLFKFSHDISGAEEGPGTVGTAVHTDYLMLADADSSNSIHIYSSHSDQWGHDVLSVGGDNSGSNNMKPCFYYVNGAVRISDGNFSTENFNTNIWYGHIDRDLFQVPVATSTDAFLGPEMITLVADRDFSSDTGNWVHLNASEAVGSGKLQVTTSTAEESEGVQLPVADMTTLVIGKRYRVAAKLDNITGGSPEFGTNPIIHFSIGGASSTIVATDGSPSDSTIDTTEQEYFADIVAVNTTGLLQIYNPSSTDGGVFYVDDVSVKEIINISSISINNWVKTSAYLAAPNISDRDIGVFRSTERDITTIFQEADSNKPGYGSLNNLVFEDRTGDPAEHIIGGGTDSAYSDVFLTTNGVLTVDDLTPSPVGGGWQASQSHATVGQTSTSVTGGGTGIYCNITTDGSGDPTFIITFAGSDYIVDEQITFTDPGTTTNTAILIVASVSGETGDATAIIPSLFLSGSPTYDEFSTVHRTGLRTGGSDSTTVLSDTGNTRAETHKWVPDALIGAKVYNLTDETDYTAVGTISDNDATTITTGTMGASSTWHTNDIYYIGGSSTNTALAGAIQEIKYINTVKVHFYTQTSVSPRGNDDETLWWLYECEVRVGQRDGNDAKWLETGYKRGTPALPDYNGEPISVAEWMQNVSEGNFLGGIQIFNEAESVSDSHENQYMTHTTDYSDAPLDLSSSTDELLVSVRLRNIYTDNFYDHHLKGVQVYKIVINGSTVKKEDITWSDHHGLAITFGKSSDADAVTPVWTDAGDQAFWTLAASYVYDKKQESLLTRTTQPISLMEGEDEYLPRLAVTVKADIADLNRVGYLKNWNPRITGTKIYASRSKYAGDTSHQTDWNLLAEIDFIKGRIRSGTSSVWMNGSSDFLNKGWIFRLGSSDLPNLPFISYESETGFASFDTDVAAKYKTAVVLGNQVYIGNVARRLPSGEVDLQPDAMYKSPFGTFDLFPESGIVTVVSMDGDDIIKLETYADRILQFKRNAMYIINVSQGIEFIEDVHHFKGISHYSATCKTDFGIAWVNRDGCYLYDGKQVSNLLEKQGKRIIDQSTWRDSTTDDSIIGYLPKQRQIIVLKDCFGVFRKNCQITSGSSSVTVISGNTSSLYVGQSVSQIAESTTLIPSSTTISSITNSTTFVMSNNAESFSPSPITILIEFGCIADIFLYDMVAGGWVFGDSLLTDGKGKTNFVVDWNNDLIWSYTVDT